MDTNALATIQQQLTPAYAPEQSLIQKQMAELPAQYDAQRTGLEQAKVNAFRDISSKARGMGVAFGGYSPSEQARYTGATYIPALGNIQTQQNSAQNSLLSALNTLGQNKYNQAVSIYQTQAAAAESKRQWEAEQAFKAQQAALDRQATASTGSSGSSNPTQAEITAGLKANLQDDIMNAFAASNSKTTSYTERTVLPTLYNAYSALGNDAINKAVYQYRKNALGY